jgi:ornithine carbamoyltransferase
MRHVLEIDDLDQPGLRQILDLASVPDSKPVLAGRGAALIFQKPSARTRNATEMAVVALGGHPISIRGDEIGIGARESVEDITRVLAQYHAVVGARVFEHGLLEAMAATDVVPIVNLLSDRAHPCQALADLLTLRQHWDRLEGRTVAWIGDGNNVARSLLLACALAGVDVRLGCPPGYQVDPVAIDVARQHGITVVATTDPREAVAGADAICTDVWVSMGQEDEAPQRLDAFAGYQVDETLMAVANAGAVFLHCLPAHRGQEVAAAVIDGPDSLVWTQARNRMHTMRGLFQWMLG